jgi:hypothetical protein
MKEKAMREEKKKLKNIEQKTKKLEVLEQHCVRRLKHTLLQE